MDMKKVVSFAIVFFIGILSLGGCMKKDDIDARQLAAKEQLTKDEREISKFILENDILATRHESGLYYHIVDKGEGNHIYTAQSNVEVKYRGRFLNGTVFDETEEGKTISFRLGQVILGWQIGMQLIQKGGKIRLLVPSGLAYGSANYAGIPPNSILDFDIELINVK